MAVKATAQGDINREVIEQHEAELLLRRTADGVVQTRFGERNALNQRIAVTAPRLLQTVVPSGDVIRLFANFPNRHLSLPA